MTGRGRLKHATLSAFQVPGKGEPFLKALEGSGRPKLEGLLLVGATAVRKDGYGGDGWDGDGDGKTGDPSALHDDGGGGLNIWAVAAVAALGAMFLVIVLCTSILYCDWRKRREWRERKRERQHAAVAASNGNYNRSVSRKSGKGSPAAGRRRQTCRRTSSATPPCR